MKILLLPKHKVATPRFVPYLGSKHRYRIWWGGRGGGKSTFVVRDNIIACLELPYYKGIMTRKIYADIKDSIYDTFKQEIMDGGLGSMFRFLKSPLEIKCANGNKIIARGFDRPDKTKSVKDPTHVIYEEANEIDEEDWIATTTSIRTTRSKYLREDFMLNPEFDGDPEDHWLVRTFIGKSNGRGKTFEDSITMDIPELGRVTSTYLVHHSTYHDNIPNLNPQFIAYLESLKDSDPYYYEVYTLGELGQKRVENRFATQYSPDKHENRGAVHRPGEKLYMMVDWNIDPFGAIYFHMFQEEGKRKCHVFDEEEVYGGTVTKLADNTKAKYHNQIPLMDLGGDAMGRNRTMGDDNQSLFTQLRDALGIRERQIKTVANPGHKESRTNLNYFLYHFDEFWINPDKCPNTCRDMKNVQVDAFGGIIKRNRKDVNQRAEHLDCVRYMENTYFHDWRVKHQKGFNKKVRRVGDRKPVNIKKIILP